MGFEALPEELLRAILEELHYASTLVTRTHDRSDLLTCALVCTSWTNPAQRMLFHSVDARREQYDVVDKSDIQEKRHGSDIAALFLRSVDSHSERGQLLGQYVRSLEVCMLEIAGPGAYADDLSPFAQLLTFCPRLYHLLVDATGVVTLSQAPMATLRKAPLPNLRALNIIRCGVQSQILYQFLDLWPAIEFVRLGSELVASPPPTACRARLYELVLGRLPSADVLDWLLANSQTSLEILECRDSPGKLLERILEVYGSQLRSLRLLRYEPMTERALQQCHRLEELCLLQVFSLTTRRYPTSVAPLPRTLRHFSFRGTRDMPTHRMKILISWIKGLSEVQTVSCNYRGKLDHADYELLREACDAKGVSLEYDRKHWWRFDDPIKTATFPRRQCAANLSRMNGHEL